MSYERLVDQARTAWKGTVRQNVGYSTESLLPTHFKKTFKMGEIYLGQSCQKNLRLDSEGWTAALLHHLQEYRFAARWSSTS